MNCWQIVENILDQGHACIVLTVTSVKGSAPREPGACMVISGTGAQFGTIGGGALEWQATRRAVDLLTKNSNYLRCDEELILGPDLEQCCGGVVGLSYELFTQTEIQQVVANARQSEQTARQNLMIFGAGHVGKALIKSLADHDFAIKWVDTRENIFPPEIPENVSTCLTNQPDQQLTSTLPDTFVLIMTHNHDLDFKIACAALQNPKISFVGLIGSATKKARFVKRFADHGLTLDQISRLTCPIGIRGINSKTPQAIAASVTAQMLISTELVKTAKNNVYLRQNHA